MSMKMKKLSLVKRLKTRTAQGDALELRYDRIETVTEDGSGAAYGVRITARQNGAQTCAEICDITSREEKIRALFALLSRGTVTPETLRDVVEDWVGTV